MVVLIVQRTSGGGKVRVCGSQCYSAKGTGCVCCCKGINHGIGLNKAVSNTRQVVQELLGRPGTFTGIKLPFKEVQL